MHVPRALRHPWPLRGAGHDLSRQWPSPDSVSTGPSRHTCGVGSVPASEPPPPPEAPLDVGWLSAAIRGRCPRCRDGKIFAGVLKMNERCPSCGLLFEREPGYFTGAMVVSYAIGVPLLAILIGVAWFGFRLPVEWALLVADLAFLIFVPAVFRWSRVLWIHLDRTVDPER